MTEDYRPRSPDFSSLQSYNPTTYETSPFFNSYPGRASQQYVPPYQDDMARRSSRIAQSDTQPIYEDMPEAIHAPIYDPVHEPVSEIAPVTDAPKMVEIPSGAGIEVKTKFPVARIKRIMQADEDVGKVAQVTPIAVCMCSRRASLSSSRAKTKY